VFGIVDCGGLFGLLRGGGGVTLKEISATQWLVDAVGAMKGTKMDLVEWWLLLQSSDFPTTAIIWTIQFTVDGASREGSIGDPYTYIGVNGPGNRGPFST
jgi:hypothetical protein